MVLPLLVLLLVGKFDLADCQVNFPTDAPDVDIKECLASNGQKGICHEFRSREFQDCAFFPSTDTSNPKDAEHLTANICRNTGKEIYFCCPLKSSSKGTEENVPQIQVDSIFTPKEGCPVSVSNNIVGGRFFDAGTFPWLAALSKKNEQFEPFCGGILITKKYVISAAHCFNKVTTNRTIVRLGEHNWQESEGEEQDFNIIDYRMRNYNRATKENDIIILQLDRAVKSFSGFIKAACLPYNLQNDSFEGNNLTVVGWGAFENNIRRPSPVPLLGIVPVVPLEECQKNYTRTKSIIDNRQLCAGIGHTDSCNGDSGGPIHYLDLDTGRFIVVGIVSFGPKLCGQNGLPGVYTRIDHHMNWIEENIRDMEG